MKFAQRTDYNLAADNAHTRAKEYLQNFLVDENLLLAWMDYFSKQLEKSWAY